ncbi:hypothetical protein EMIT0196MI5_40236 [Pseudomonas sp. IT-196MI5]
MGALSAGLLQRFAAAEKDFMLNKLGFQRGF